MVRPRKLAPAASWRPGEPLVDLARLDLPVLAHEFAQGKPFPHLVLDGFLAQAARDALRTAFEWERHYPSQDDIYSFLTSAEPPAHALLRQFGDELGSLPVREAVQTITGRASQTADVRGFVYLPGHYLLPHTDAAKSARRAVAYIYYLDIGGPLRGGELVLYQCSLRGEHVSRARPAVTIAPRANRLVLFEVTHQSLHEVREVLHGARMSLAGWFIA